MLVIICNTSLVGSEISFHFIICEWPGYLTQGISLYKLSFYIGKIEVGIEREGGGTILLKSSAEGPSREAEILS